MTKIQNMLLSTELKQALHIDNSPQMITADMQMLLELCLTVEWFFQQHEMKAAW